MAPAPEVVVVDRPKHDPSQVLLVHVPGFQPDDIFVVVAYPLVTLVRVRAHRLWIRLNHFPLVRLRQPLADLPVKIQMMYPFIIYLVISFLTEVWDRRE